MNGNQPLLGHWVVGKNGKEIGTCTSGDVLDCVYHNISSVPHPAAFRIAAVIKNANNGHERASHNKILIKVNTVDKNAEGVGVGKPPQVFYSGNEPSIKVGILVSRRLQ